jgi:hypothetical protein
MESCLSNVTQNEASKKATNFGGTSGNAAIHPRKTWLRGKIAVPTWAVAGKACLKKNGPGRGEGPGPALHGTLVGRTGL